MISCIFYDRGYGSEFHKLRAEDLREDGANSVIPIYLKSQRASVSEVTGSTYLEQLDEALLKRRSAPTAAVIDIRVSPSAISLVIARSHSKLSKHWSGTSDLFLWCEV